MSIDVKQDFLEIDHQPVFIFGGDLSYCRVPRRLWKTRMLQMKQAGLNTVTVYIVWGYHQAGPGQFDFTGERDIAHFVDLIQECGMYCIYRMGPFVHGEFRNGGIPQWLFDELGDRVRTNDPRYLEYARLWYEKLIDIAKPRLHRNGGPIILLQLENELGSAGCKGDDLARGSASPEDNKRHLLFYYNLIRDKGLDLPLLDINHIPDKEKLISPLLDTCGMYPVNCFNSDGDLRPFNTDWWDQHQRPMITIETGAGMFVRYYDTPAYRNTNGFQGPLIKPEIVEATVMTHIAEGCGGVCLYIFCDGQNPPGMGERMLPERDMNYQAPITVAGRLRDSYWKLKRLGWFMRSFGQEVLHSEPRPTWAKVQSCGIPHPGPQTGGDLFENYGREFTAEQAANAAIPATSRITRGLNLSESNFIFMRNVFNGGASWKRDVKVLVAPSQLACEVWHEYPKKTQLELMPQTMKIMPFFVRLCPHHFLEYSTAELLDRRPCGDKTQVILCESPEIMTETRLVLPDIDDLKTVGNVLVLRESPNCITLVARPERQPIVLETEQLRIVLVTKAYAEHLWDVGPEAAWSNAVLQGDRKNLTVETENANFRLEMLTSQPPHVETGLVQATESYDAQRKLYALTGTFKIPEVALSWKRSYEGNDLILTCDLPELPDDAEDIILTLNYDGSLGQATLDTELVSDHAYGRFLPWEISLHDLCGTGKSLKILCHDATECQIRTDVRIKRTITLG